MLKKSNTKKIAGGLGLAAIAAAAAATYYFKGPSGKKHVKEVTAMAKKAKMEMLAKIKQMEGVSKKAYDQAASEIIGKYKQAKGMDSKELVELGKELKSHWENIAKTVQKGVKTISVTGSKKVIKKTSTKKK